MNEVGQELDKNEYFCQLWTDDEDKYRWSEEMIMTNFMLYITSVLWAERMKKFEAKFLACDKIFLHYGHCMD